MSPPWSSLLPHSFLPVNWDPYLPSHPQDIQRILADRPWVAAGQDSFSLLSRPIGKTWIKDTIGKKIISYIFCKF